MKISKKKIKFVAKVIVAIFAIMIVLKLLGIAFKAAGIGAIILLAVFLVYLFGKNN